MVQAGRTTVVLLGAVVANGLLVGASLDQSIKQLPARHRIGVEAFSAYSQAADLRNGVAWYATLGLGAAAVTLAAAAHGRRDPFHAGAAAALAAVGLAVLVGLAFSWLNALFGLLVREAESAGLAGLLGVIPLIFASSTFVPVATMPGWLQAFAKANPVTVTVTVDALRVLCLGGPTATHVWQAVAWIAALLALAVPAAVARYRHTTAT